MAGLVSITAGCGSVEPYGSFVIGLIGGFVYMSFSHLLVKLKIDDPLDAFAVHGGCGCWAVLSLGFFDINEGVFYKGDGKQIGIQLMGIVVIFIWTALLSGITFFGLKKFNLLRISAKEENEGIDWVEHGGKAYHINEVVSNGDNTSDSTESAEQNVSTV